MNYRHACVTGGAGFIGSKLVAALISQGAQVTVLDNLTTGRRANLHPNACLIEADILDARKTEEAISGCDVVFHLAARVAIRSSFEFIVEDTSTNVAGTASVLRAAQLSGTVRRVIYTSSMAVYSDAPSAEPIAETREKRPISPYGISKLAGEDLTHSLCQTAGMESVAVRLFNTFGPGQLFSPYVGVVTIFVNKLARGETPAIFGDGNQARDFVHVQDVVAGFLGALAPGVSGQTFNIGTGRATTVNQLYRLVAEKMGSSRQPAYAAAMPGELRNSVADIGKARELLGYAPSRSLEANLGAVVDEILQQGVGR